MDINRCGLIVVDVQNGFLTEATRHVLPVIVELVDRWQNLNGSTIYSRYFNYAGSAFEEVLGWKHLYSSPETDIVKDLASHARSSSIVDKDSYSAVTPQFIELVRENGWTDVAICGIDTDLCVLKTALDVFEAGLTPWTIIDASASTGGSVSHQAGLTVLGRAVGEHHLVTTEELLLMF